MAIAGSLDTEKLWRLRIDNGEVRNDRSLAGDIKKRINSRKKRDLGPVVKDVDVYTQHFRWLKALESEMKRTKEVPQWLG